MIDVDKALRLFKEQIDSLGDERVGLDHALMRVAAEDVVSGVDLPPFAQSAMDGYAFRAEDVREANEESPITLEVVGEVAAGQTGELVEVGPGEASRIFTGARVPPRADTVVRQERVERDGDRLVVPRAFERGGDLRPAGEELAADAVIVEAGTRLDEGHLAALSMTGHAELAVRVQPQVSVLVSGDEVVAPGLELEEGQVYDANTPMVANWLRRRGYDDVEIIHLEDEREVVRRELDRALTESDLVISTGGVSVGEYDFLVDVAEEVGLETVFWKVSQKPGKPLLFARRGATPFLGIPGNPGAVFAATHVYVRRALDLLERAEPVGPVMQRGRLTAPVSQSRRRMKWTGCALSYDEEGRIELTPAGGHRLGQMYRCDALARMEAGEGEMAKGAVVEWLAL